MDSKTPPVQATPSAANTASSTSQQALALFAQLAKHQPSTSMSLVVPDKLLASLQTWFATKPQPKLEQLPPPIAHWLTATLNKHHTQANQPKLTLSQWLPLIAQMQLAKQHTHQHSNSRSGPSSTVLQQDVLRLLLMVGSTQIPNNALARGQTGSATATTQQGITQLINLLVPISLQDKATLVLRQQHSHDNGDDPESSSDHDDRQSDAGAAPSLSFVLTFDLDRLGQLTIDVNLTALSLQSKCYCSNLKLQSNVEQFWPQLESRLQQFGFSVDNDIVLKDEPDSLDPTGKRKPSQHNDRGGQSAHLIDIKV